MKIKFSISLTNPAQLPQVQLPQIQLPEAQLALLKESGAGQHSHTHRSLLDHLTGTYKLLKDWGAPQHVCEAGLFHSIYGISIYRHQSLAFEERSRVQAVISQEGEQLAWMFCVIDRPQALLQALQGQALRSRLNDGLLECTEQQLQDLVEIEAANFIEQKGRNPAVERIYLMALSKGWLREPVAEALKKRFSTKHAFSNT
jgi:hypothetical protein